MYLLINGTFEKDHLPHPYPSMVIENKVPFFFYSSNPNPNPNPTVIRDAKELNLANISCNYEAGVSKSPFIKKRRKIQGVQYSNSPL